MRRARWLLLVVLVAIIGAVGSSYLKRKDTISKEILPQPKHLDSKTDGQFGDWTYEQSDGDKPKVRLRAKKSTLVREPSVWELDGVELQMFRSHAKTYDLIKSAKAEFDLAAKSLYSDGDVDITMDIPVDKDETGEAPASGKILRIQTSGVHFSSETGKAVTERRAAFEFDRGSGSSVGAEYDPNLRELLLKSQVALDWKGKTPDAPPMHIEAADAIYRELESKVILNKWSKLSRGSLTIDAATTLVTLDKGAVRVADVEMAKGVQDDPARKVEFAADGLSIRFGENMAIESIEGTQHARVVSTGAAARTTITGDRVDLAFTPSGHDSILTSAVSAGGSVAEAVPLPKPGADLPETRTLHSDVIRISMRKDGREIEKVETDGPATLDFTPNRPAQPQRTLSGQRVWIAYGADNRIQSFRSVNVTTRTEQDKRMPITTRSKDFLATFDLATSQLSQIEQKTDFQYQEGDRQARGDKAVLDQVASRMKLDGAARVWDPTGSASADHIEIDQKTGDYTAEGRVATTHQPDKNGSSSAMLSNQDVLQARAQHMVSTKGGRVLHYEGNAVAWQGANRMEASKLDIDRDRRVMEGHGNVVSQFVDRTPPEGKAKSPTPVFTVVRAPDLVYADEMRIANYTGGVQLNRPGLTVNSTALKAFLNDSSSDNSLDKAYADGAVKIVSVSVDSPRGKRTRTGTSSHAEYYAADQKVILEGGDPQLVDSLKGKTSGRQLTWYANNDRLLVDGAEKQPVVTIIHKK